MKRFELLTNLIPQTNPRGDSRLYMLEHIMGMRFWLSDGGQRSFL
jgi:hypothetical protein